MVLGQGQAILPSLGAHGFLGQLGRSGSGMQAFQFAFTTNPSSASLTAAKTLNSSPADSLLRSLSDRRNGPWVDPGWRRFPTPLHCGFHERLGTFPDTVGRVMSSVAFPG